MHEKSSRLRKALKKKRVQNKEVAEKCGYGDSTVSQYLSGAKPVPDRFLQLVCTVFGINLDWVETGEGEMFAPSRQDGTDRQHIAINGLDAVQVAAVVELVDILKDSSRPEFYQLMEHISRERDRLLREREAHMTRDSRAGDEEVKNGE